MTQSSDELNLLKNERDIIARLGDRNYDMASTEVIGNIYRAAAAIRRRAEQGVLRDEQLSWGAFTALWVLWIWGDMETNVLASECDLSKGTLTGILNTLEGRGLVARHRVPEDRRRMAVELTPAGQALIEELSPRFNAFETDAASSLTGPEKSELARLLRRVIVDLDDNANG